MSLYQMVQEIYNKNGGKDFNFALINARYLSNQHNSISGVIGKAGTLFVIACGMSYGAVNGTFDCKINDVSVSDVIKDGIISCGTFCATKVNAGDTYSVTFSTASSNSASSYIYAFIF